LDRSDQRGLPLDQTYRYTSTGSGIQAFVVDTGVRADHAQLAGRVTGGFSSIGGGTSDCNGHGTHVAGTIGANLYGVAKDVTIVPVRVLDCNGSGTWSGVIAGLDWIAGAGSPTTSVVNMSLGGGANSLVDDAVRNLTNRGFTVVVAAGNSNADACRYSPAGVREAITVGATDSSDSRASYSNFGDCLDLFAPGTSITSLWHTSSTASTTLSGTSMASPHVAGAVALILQSGPASPAAMSDRLRNLATAGVVANAGNRSPNLLLFTLIDGETPVEEPREEEPSDDAPIVVLPSQPEGVVAAAGNRSAFVAWSAPADTGGVELTGYTVTAYERMRNGRIRGAGSVSIDAGSTDLRVTGLRQGATYRFTVAATNSFGTGPESDPSNWVTATR
jgi:subtilisin family serine protease